MRQMTEKQRKRIVSGSNMIIAMMQRMTMGSFDNFEEALRDLRNSREGCSDTAMIAAFNAFYSGYTGPDAKLESIAGLEVAFTRIILLGVQAAVTGLWDRDDYFEHREVIFAEAKEAIVEMHEDAMAAI